MFSRPLPDFSCKLNAWATWLTCQWLMGPCEVNDVEVDGGGLGVGQGVLVKRCAGRAGARGHQWRLQEQAMALQPAL